MRIGSLFSGAGGLDMAVAEVFGGEVVWYSEIDKAASKVLAHRFPGVPNLGDITAVDWVELPEVDVLCGGFPCQDVSAAGKRAGIKAGTRSGLWSVFADAIDALRPRFVVIENVRGLLSAAAHRDVECDQGIVGDGAGQPVLRAAGAVLGDLADLGYDAQWTTLAASAVGAPHRRERVFILAQDTASTGDRAKTGNQAGRAQTFRSASGTGGSIDGAPAAAAPRNGWDEGRTESAGFVGGSDVAVSRDGDVALLPTPSACNPNDGEGTETWLARREAVKARVKNGNGMGMPLSIAVQLLPGAEPVSRDGDVALLPTPQSTDGMGGGTSHPDQRRQNNHQLTLPQVVRHDLSQDAAVSRDGDVALLPTPRASDPAGAESRSSEGFRPQLGEVVRQLGRDGDVALLPTPRVGGGGDCESERRRNSPGLESIAVTNLLPTPNASDCSGGGMHPDSRYNADGLRHSRQLIDEVKLEPERWGKYEPAIRRWESIVGPAPAPTEPNKNGNPRLSAAFSEWLMGWPAGWVTDPAIGISRNDQLRIVGNGVVPLQAEAAIRFLLAVPA